MIRRARVQAVAAEQPQLARGQPPRLARPQIPQQDRAEAGARERQHWMPDRLQQPPHLAVAPGVQRQRQPRGRIAVGQDAPRPPRFARLGPQQSVLRLDPLVDPVQLSRPDRPAHLDQIGARNLAGRMQQPRDQRPVVGEQQQALAVQIEPAHGYAASGSARQQFDHGRPPAIVARRRKHARRLVQREVAQRLRCAERLAVQRDDLQRPDPLRRVLGGPPVDGDAAGPDQFVRPPPRGRAAARDRDR